MKVVPIADKIVVQAPKEPANKAGIEMSRASQERPLIADVIAVGDEVKRIKVGQRVCYTRFAPNEIEVEGETYFVLEEKQVLVVIE